MRTRLYFIVLSLYLPLAAEAQNVYCNEYLPPEPQSWGLIKYNGQRPNLYSGTVHAEIPIYTYRDPDFEIPISLSYSSNGYMPNITTNYVGLGWTLNVGGVVSRRVRGAKDEGISDNVSYGGGTTSVRGMYRYVSSNYSGARDTLLTGLGMCIGVAGQIFETESDIYMFSFMGHTGKFVISEQGSVQIYDTNRPSGEYRVSLSQFKATRYKSIISISTGDGYNYEFGNYAGVSNLTHLPVEYEKWGAANPSGTPSQDEYSDDWFLTKITAPNGRTVSFSYKIDSETMFESMHPGGKYESFRTYTSTGGTMASIYSASAVYNDSFRLLERKYAVLPSSITIDGCTISFVYGEREAEKGWKVVTHSSDLLTPVKLEEIHVTHTQVSSNLCDCTLTYKYPNASGNRVLLLSKVSVAGSGEYSMNYYNENGVFPFQGETCIDHWGYYNNNSGIDPLHMIPNAEVNDSYYETLLSQEREPDWTKVKYGLLRKMVYPTGGWSEFEYTPNTYSKKVQRVSTPNSGAPYSAQLSSDVQGGGMRISRIVDYASNNEWNDRLYEYQDGARSSGIMLKYPRYISAFRSSSINQHIDYRVRDTGSPGYMLDEFVIAYSTVTERYKDNSCRKWQFSDYNTFPDILVDAGGGYLYRPVGDIIAPHITSPDNAYRLFRTPQSMFTARGKLLKEEVYDTEGQLRTRTLNTYDFEGIKDRYVQSVKLSSDSVYVCLHYSGDCLLKKSRKTEFLRSGDSLYVLRQFEHNNRHQVNNQIVTDSRGVKHYHKSIFIGDGFGTQTYPEYTLSAKNIINKPIYEIDYTVLANRYVPVSVKHYVYDFFSARTASDPLLKSVETADVTVTMPFASLDEVTTLTYKKEYEITKYNQYWRPCEAKDANGVYSVLLWGYGGLYPVGLFNNVDGQTMGHKVAMNDISTTIMGWSGLDNSSEKTFRGIPGVTATTWKYSPFVGVSEVTGPDGRKTSYTYNEYGRLSAIIGPDNHRLNSYNYSINGIIQ